MLHARTEIAGPLAHDWTLIFMQDTLEASAVDSDSRLEDFEDAFHSFFVGSKLHDQRVRAVQLRRIILVHGRGVFNRVAELAESFSVFLKLFFVLLLLILR